MPGLGATHSAPHQPGLPHQPRLTCTLSALPSGWEVRWPRRSPRSSQHRTLLTHEHTLPRCIIRNAPQPEPGHWPGSVPNTPAPTHTVARPRPHTSRPHSPRDAECARRHQADRNRDVQPQRRRRGLPGRLPRRCQMATGLWRRRNLLLVHTVCLDDTEPSAAAGRPRLGVRLGLSPKPRAPRHCSAWTTRQCQWPHLQYADVLVIGAAHAAKQEQWPEWWPEWWPAQWHDRWQGQWQQPC